MSILYNIYTHVFTEYFDRYGLSGEAGAKKNTVSGYPSLAVGVWPAWDTPAKGRGYPGSDNPFRKWLNIPIPIGSMYAIYNIYSNIYHQYTPNVGKYSIHGSYGICEPWCWNMNPNMCPKKITQFCRFLYSSTMVRIWAWYMVVHCRDLPGEESSQPQPSPVWWFWWSGLASPTMDSFRQTKHFLDMRAGISVSCWPGTGAYSWAWKL